MLQGALQKYRLLFMSSATLVHARDYDVTTVTSYLRGFSSNRESPSTDPRDFNGDLIDLQVLLFVEFPEEEFAPLFCLIYTGDYQSKGISKDHK